jgi:hypothetical protein
MIASSDSLAEQLAAFSQNVKQQIPALLYYYRSATNAGAACYIDQPGQLRRVRPWCDAVEISAMFSLIPDGMTSTQWIDALRGLQDHKTGLVPEYIPDDDMLNPPLAKEPEKEDRYNTMIVNYALECLGSNVERPIANAEEVDADRLVNVLESLNWTEAAWGAGHWVDCYATSLYINRRYFEQGRRVDNLFAWLDSHCDPQTGVWGMWRKNDRWLQSINGFYRLTRGSYAQFGRPLPYPEKAIDNILTHSSDLDYFGPNSMDACNVLDVVHPLWLCLKQTTHRKEEAQQWIRSRLPDALSRWLENQGLAFDSCGRKEKPGDLQGIQWMHKNRPSLRGTEMWLSIIFLMADVLEVSGNLSYRPQGVHRLESPAQSPNYY